MSPIIRKTNSGIILSGEGLMPAVREFIDGAVMPVGNDVYRIFDGNNKIIDAIARNIYAIGKTVRLINEVKSETKRVVIGDRSFNI